MEIRNPGLPLRSSVGNTVGANSGLRVSIFAVLVLLAGCASPGEPVERKAQVPAAVTDLAAEQSGNGALLSFTLPRETAERRLLKHPPDVEIYREFVSGAAGIAASPASGAAPLVTIPFAVTGQYEREGEVRYVDVWSSDVLKQHAGDVASYVVRSRESRKKSSADSNVASLRVYPVPEPIGDLQVELAPAAVRLTWTAPKLAETDFASAVQGYRIYRAVLSPGDHLEKASSAEEPGPFATVTSGASSGNKRRRPDLVKIGESQSETYEDSQVKPGATYEYSVRSVVEYSGAEAASSDSNLATITMRDIFPPTAPTGLLAVFVPHEESAVAHIDLSWKVSPETDVAGYNVYRSEQEGSRGSRLNPELLPTPAFSDMSAVAGQRYFYSVTAVDRSGNESEPSVATSSEAPAESKP